MSVSAESKAQSKRQSNEHLVRPTPIRAFPREREARLALLRRGLIPWLAGVDPETKSPRRNIARRADIPEEARPLIDLLVEERLLSTDVATDRTGESLPPSSQRMRRCCVNGGC